MRESSWCQYRVESLSKTNGGGKPMTTYNDGLFGLGDDCKGVDLLREKGEQ